MTPEDSFYDQSTRAPLPEVPSSPAVPAPDLPVALSLPPEDDEVVLTVPAPRQPHPGFWASLGWCVLFMLATQGIALAVMIGVLLALAMLSDNPQATLKGMGNAEALRGSAIFARALAAGMFVAEAVSVFLAWLVIRLVVGADWKRRLALRRPGMAHFLLGLLMFVAAMVLANTVAYLVKQAQVAVTGQGSNELEETMKVFGEWPLPFAVLVIGIGPGIAEELWCRGFLGRGLVGRYGAVLGVLLTSIWFGLMHVYPLHQVAGTMVLGLVLHFIYLTTRSLLLPMFLHFLNNSVALVATRLAAPSSATDAEAFSPLLCVGAIVLAVAAGWALYRSRARLQAGADHGQASWVPDYPGVEFPPAGSGTIVVRPWPGWLSSGLVLAALAIFAGTIVLAGGL
jgi:membrane protease YdiL (CAAX protease family)